MDNTLCDLENQIEIYRSELSQLLSHNNPTNTSVLKCSQYLDKLIVAYEKQLILLNTKKVS